MSNNYFSLDRKEEIKTNGFYQKFVLYISFVWLCFFPSISSIVSNIKIGYGSVFDFSSGNTFYLIMYALEQALFEMIGFEIIFWIYRLFLSTKVYTFVIPEKRFGAEFRTYFAVRNFIYGLLLNLCFLYPFLYSFDFFFNIFITFLVLIIFSYNLQEKYSESIIGQFVFSNFCYPVIFYEAIVGILYFWRCM